MYKKIFFALIAIVAVAGGAWYFMMREKTVPIHQILGTPERYSGKELTIEGEVTDRTAFFGSPKFYKVKDKTGEIIVVTKRGLPEISSTRSVKGMINSAFPLGNDRIVVFEEKSV